jgi:hypothetical protein
MLGAFLPIFSPAPAPVGATTIEVTLQAIDSGWYTDLGLHTPDNMNYLVGRSGYQYRNFFVFDLSTISNQTLAARLEAFNRYGFGEADGFKSPQAFETWELYDVTAPAPQLRDGTAGIAAYNDLGTGAVFGSVQVTSADNDNSFVELELNADALASLNSAAGLWAVGGRFTTLDGFADQYVFGNSGGNDPLPRLVLTIVPEPSCFSLAGWLVIVCGLSLRPCRIR